MAMETGRSVLEKGGGLVRLFTRHPNAANLLMVLMILAGIFSIARINTQFFPTLEIKTVTVVVSWPGASAQDVESNILEIIEPEVRFIDGVDKITAYAREGSGTISLEFSQAAEMQKATADVESAVKAITTLPEDSETPRVTRVQFFDRVASISLSGDVPEQTLRIHARKMRDDLIARGIDKVDFTGMRDRELQVEIDEAKLRQLGMSLNEISQRVAGNTRDMPSGNMDGQVEQQLRALAEFKSPRSLGQVEVRSFATGEKVYLSDIAKIHEGFEDGQVQGLSGSGTAIELTIRRAPTADTLVTARILDKYLEDASASLPPGLEVRKYDVAADALMERIMLLVRNGLSGLILVVAILFLFLNSKIALWVAAGIPVAMLATIGIMLVLGQTINMITLFGLIMMLGIIVDDAIVVGEHTATRFEAGDTPLEAAEEGASRMIMPVMAAMTTTLAAFAPIFMIRDTIGQIMSVLPVIVISVLLASLLECFFILPGHLAHALEPSRRRGWSHVRHLIFSFVFGAAIIALSARARQAGIDTPLFSFAAQIAAARSAMPPAIFFLVLTAASFLVGALAESIIMLLRRKKGSATESGNEHEWAFRAAFDNMFERFRSGPFASLVTLAFHWRYVTLAVSVSCVLVLAVGLIAGGRVGFVFFPSPEAENLNANVVFQSGIPEPRARQILNEIGQSLQRTEIELGGEPGSLVSATFSALGRAGQNVGESLAEINVQLLASEFRTVRTGEILKAWRRNLPKLPGVSRISLSERRGGPPGRDIDLELTGADVATLKKAAVEIIDVMSSVPGLSGIADDLPYGKPELIMKLLPRGSALGFTTEEVGRQVRDAFEGAIPRRFASGDEEVAIRLSMDSQLSGMSGLRNLELRTSTGEFVPLTEVVSLTGKQGFSSIQRQDGKTIVSLTGDLDSAVMTTEKAIALLSDSQMPQIAARYGLDWQFAGRALEREKAFADLGYGLMIAIAVIYIILAWTFSSYWRPVAIMLIIPLGLVGAVLGHWLMGFNLTIMSLISLLGLAGILVNDSIVLVSRMDERLDQGEDLAHAAIGASQDRLRAVLLTSLTTIGGLVPLLFEKSVQAQFMIPMALTIVFGLGVATLIVLFLVPALVGIGDDIRRAAASIFAAPQAHETPAE
ncbi:MAG: efflux RND transporter permease subunit [Rhizobiaceae bacterium]